MRLDRKPTKLTKSGNMRPVHPFYIWQILRRFAAMDKLADNEGNYHSIDEVIPRLFSNFDKLGTLRKIDVLNDKLQRPVWCLEHMKYIKLKTYTMYHLTMDIHGEVAHHSAAGFHATALPGAFGNNTTLDSETKMRLEYELIDDEWRRYRTFMREK